MDDFGSKLEKDVLFTLDRIRSYERNKAIDDFVRFANTMPTVESEDGTIRPMWLEEMAEKLKKGGNADLLIDKAKSKSEERIPYDGKWK